MNIKKRFQSQRDLLQAVEKNEISVAQGLIEKGCDVNALDKGESTPLMRAAFHGYSELITILLRSGADPNLSDKIGKTALHYAAQEYHEDAAAKLLDSGADVNSQDIHGNTPLSNAVFYSQGRGALITLLRSRGADDGLPNKQGVTPLALAKSIANYNLFQYFEQKT